MSKAPTEVKLPTDNKVLYVPVYTIDGIIWEALEPTFYLPTAKSRLCSHLPEQWRIKACPEKYKDVRGGLAIIPINVLEFHASFLELRPDDFSEDKAPTTE
jgi:hypothetical protein